MNSKTQLRIRSRPHKLCEENLIAGKEKGKKVGRQKDRQEGELKGEVKSEIAI